MAMPKPIKMTVCLLLSLQLTNLPSVAAADQLMIPTTDVVAELTREGAEQAVAEYVNTAHVREALASHGLSSEEITSRLASLSETELRELAGQIEQAKAGGDILVTILLIVLIILLIKKI